MLTMPREAQKTERPRSERWGEHPRFRHVITLDPGRVQDEWARLAKNTAPEDNAELTIRLQRTLFRLIRRKVRRAH